MSSNIDTRTRFEEEAALNSEMTYFTSLLGDRVIQIQLNLLNSKQ